MDSVWTFETEKSWDYENGYYLTSHPTRLVRAITHWELYKKIISLPGEVVECGVFKGASSIRFATYRDMAETPQSRKIIGFDAFGAFPPATTLPGDIAFIEKFEGESGHGIPIEELNNCFKHKEFRNFEFVRGDVCQTVPEYVAAHQELKIAFLHVDVDVYEPSKIVMEHLFERVVPGGLIVLDDYGLVPGETKAVDDFLAGRREGYILHKLPYYRCPVYFQKKAL